MEEVNIVEVEPQLVIGLRMKGPYNKIAEMLPEMFKYMQKKGLRCIGAPVFVCHENAEEAAEAAKNGNADLEVCVPVGAKFEDDGEYKCYELPGGKMAKAVYKGPYDKMMPVYEKIFAWVAEKNLKINGYTREVYLNDPREDGVENAITEIYIPVE